MSIARDRYLIAMMKCSQRHCHRAYPVFKDMQRVGHSLVHIPVTIRAKAATKDEVGRFGRIIRVPSVYLGIAGVVDGVIRFVALFVCLRVLATDDRLVQGKGFLAFGVVVLELMHAGIGNIRIRVVHHGRALIVSYGQRLPCKTQRTPFQFAVFEAKKLVGHPGIDDRGVGGYPAFELRVVAVQPDRDERMIQHLPEKAEVTVFGHPLPGILEIVGVVGGAERQPADDGHRKFTGIVFPLLVRVALDKSLVQLAADERDSFFFQIPRLTDEVTGYLGLQKGFGFGGTQVCAVKGVDGTQVDGHGVDLAPMRNEHLVLIAGELAKTVDVLPHVRQRSMEDMRSVAVAFNTRLLIQRGMTVAADMIAPVNDGDRVFEDCSDALSHD